MTLPIAISACFFSVASTEVASSGSEVPIATTVSPIKASDRPAALAMSVAPDTSRRPPHTIATSPPTANSADRGSE